MKEEAMQSDENIHPTVPKEILNGYEFDPHPYLVETDQLNGYYDIGAPTDNTSYVSNEGNIPAIITDIVNDVWN